MPDWITYAFIVKIKWVIGSLHTWGVFFFSTLALIVQVDVNVPRVWKFDQQSNDTAVPTDRLRPMAFYGF